MKKMFCRTQHRRTAFILSAVFLCLCALFYAKMASAQNQADVTSEEGKIKYTTIDTKATSGIRWKTVGFTITKEKCLSGSKANGGYPTKLKYAVIWLEQAEKKRTDLGNGSVKTEFVLSKDAVDKALVQGGFESIRDEDVLYLHGIFQVVHNGTDYGSKIYSLPEIVKAENWRNPDDFKDRFDIKVVYHSGKDPVVIEYRTNKGNLIEEITYPKKDYVRTGEKVSVTLDKKRTYLSKPYILTRSYYVQNKYSSSLKSVKKVSEDGMDAVSRRTFRQCLGGIRIVAIMAVDKPDHSDSYLYGELEEMEALGTIFSNEFEVTEGIPSSEYVSINVDAPVYCREYTFHKVSVEKTYPVTLRVVYYLTWQEQKDGKIQIRSDQVTKTYHTEVTRKYSYWEIESLAIFRIKKAFVSNGALEGGTRELSAKVKEKQIECITYEPQAHVKEPQAGRVYETSVSLTGSGSRPKIEETDVSVLRKADSLVEEVKVRNDFLMIDDLCVMDDEWCQTRTKKPMAIPEWNERTKEGDVSADAVLIPAQTRNEIYPSSGYVIYECCLEVNWTHLRRIRLDLSKINDICVHTPVVCEPRVEDQIKYNQEIHPDVSRAGLVLDTVFSISYPTMGQHLPMKGYGYRDYAKYMSKRVIRFPFDVYVNGQYYPAGSTWRMSGTEISCYLPTWVEEGDYDLEFYTAAINVQNPDDRQYWEEQANRDRSNTVACQIVPVHVSGRLYGMQVYDISDYPLWRDVFRINKGTEWNGFAFHAGSADSFGNELNRKNVLPVMKGSHPYNKEEGVVPTGYYIRYRITTIGNLTGADDYIHIKPFFYYCSKDGKIREKVDVYYGEEIDGIYYPLVKVGSEKDKENSKTINLWNPYLIIPDSLRTDWKNSPRVYTYQNIMLSQRLRSYHGNTRLINGILPGEVDRDVMQKSVQYWYGEYHLPAAVHVAKEGTDVYTYGKNHGITFEEPFWYQDGYLIVAFQIESIDERKPHLSYRNEENSKNGYCNMWKMENQILNRTDSSGNVFHLEYGDVFFYDLSRSTAKDYRSAGTH
ncbi:MAG: DUF5704 domain-containing protein [Clostridiales bacterium]|nr:DUF5704 domain-containing protein [Clostridiales bacterium]